MPGVSKLSLEDTKVQTPKRRGRGTFAYKKHELYSDQMSNKIVVDNDSMEEETVCHNLEGDEETQNCKLIFPFFKSPHCKFAGSYLCSLHVVKLNPVFSAFKLLVPY